MRWANIMMRLQAYRMAYQKTQSKERERRGKIAKKMAYCYAKSLQAAKAIAAYRNVERYHQDDIADLLSLASQLMKTGSYREAGLLYIRKCWTLFLAIRWRLKV